jgi:hypothetical protein
MASTIMEFHHGTSKCAVCSYPATREITAGKKVTHTCEEHIRCGMGSPTGDNYMTHPNAYTAVLAAR